MKITTNNVPRDLIDGFELTAEEREQFDYHDWAKIDAGEDSASFFRYKGDLYDLGNFERLEATPDWDGGFADSFFSGILVRWAKDENGQQDPERIVVGWYYE